MVTADGIFFCSFVGGGTALRTGCGALGLAAEALNAAVTETAVVVVAADAAEVVADPTAGFLCGLLSALLESSLGAFLAFFSRRKRAFRDRGRRNLGTGWVSRMDLGVFFIVLPND